MDFKSSLQELFKFVNNREYEINCKIFDENGTKLKVNDSKNFEKTSLIKYLKNIISPYIIEKIKYQFYLSLDYSVEDLFDADEKFGHFW